MKQYIDPKGLRLVGKAWEIRHQLRKINGSPKSPRKLNDWLKSGSAPVR
ncbi:Z-ring formation inhibitor MciZ [Paenibacillus darwinianus]|nr:Z-ring formation inhibitor MciZ [Paenibacillus darwinianus]